MLQVNSDQIKKLVPFLSADPTRRVLAYVGLQEGYLYATDGQKMGRLPVEACGFDPAGFQDQTCFQVVKVGKSYALDVLKEAETFPNGAQLYKKGQGKRWTITAGTGSKKSGQLMASLLYRLALQGVCMNPVQVAALPEGSYTVSAREDARGLSPVFFVDGEFEAIIMPMREDAEKVEAVEVVEAVAVVVGEETPSFQGA